MSLPLFPSGLTLVALVLALAMAVSCAAEPKPGAVDPLAALQGNWVLAELDGAAVPNLGEGLAKPGLTIAEEGRLSGFAGVNRFAGVLDTEALARGQFESSPLASTKMAGPPAAMEFEQRFLKAVEDADGYRWEGTALLLTRGSTTLARLTRAT